MIPRPQRRHVGARRRVGCHMLAGSLTPPGGHAGGIAGYCRRCRIAGTGHGQPSARLKTEPQRWQLGRCRSA